MALGYIVPQGFPELPGGWTSRSETVEASSGGLNLFVLCHEKSGISSRDVKRVALIVHGLGEHIGRYSHVPSYLKDVVDVVYGYDHRGHGRSGGTRGYVNRFEEYVLDLEGILRTLRNRYPQAEIHCLAHSMGGLITLLFLQAHPEYRFQSCVLSSPLIDFKIEIPVIKKAIAHALSNLWGDLQLASGLEPSELSRDPAIHEAYHQDMLIHKKATPRLYMEMKKSLEKIRGDSSILKTPTLVLVPLADSIVSAEATLEFAKIQDSEKTTGSIKVVELPEGRHESMNDLDRSRVFQEIAAWIQAHSKN